MARLTIKGLEEFSMTLERLGNDAENVMKAAVYAGADKAVSLVKDSIRALPTDPGYKQAGTKRASVTPDEPADLLEHVGISHMDSTGSEVTAAIGFNGYSRHKTKAYPNGLPMPLLARSIESGSSVRQKVPFVRRAKSNQAQIKAAMEEAARKKIEEMTR